MNFNEDIVKALFLLAGFDVDNVYKIENQYWPEDERYDTIRKNSPWYLVKVKQGIIKIGWRKRVLSINWADTKISVHEITKDDVTKETTLVHAWTYPKALEYLINLKIAIRSIED